jgi:hypothetical protein
MNAIGVGIAPAAQNASGQPQRALRPHDEIVNFVAGHMPVENAHVLRMRCHYEAGVNVRAVAWVHGKPTVRNGQSS